MLKEIGTVERVVGDKVAVRFKRRKACSCCRYMPLCGQGERAVLIPHKGGGFRCGERVEVGMEEKKTIFSAFLVFLVPPFLFLVTLFFSQAVKEYISFLVAVMVLFVYYMIVKFVLSKKEHYFQLKILRKL